MAVCFPVRAYGIGGHIKCFKPSQYLSIGLNFYIIVIIIIIIIISSSSSSSSSSRSGGGRSVGGKENRGIKNISTEDYNGNIIVGKRQALQMWENYITELHERRNRPENLEVEPAEEVDADEKG
jgi:hypothetical protein